MGVAPDKFLQSKNVYRLLVLLALASVVVNFFFPGALKSHALPNTVAMYSLRPVANYDKYLYHDADTDEATTDQNIQKLSMTDLFQGSTDGVDKFGDNKYNAHGLSELQLVKYMQGCYGAPDLVDDHKAWVLADGDDTTRTALLNTWQFSTAGVGDNVCTCIDDMFAASTDDTKFGYCYAVVADYDEDDDTYIVEAEYAAYQAACGDTKTFATAGTDDAQGSASVNSAPALTTAEFEARVAAFNLPKYISPADDADGIPHTTAMNAGKYRANAFSSAGGISGAEFMPGRETSTVRAKYHEDITRLCIESAIPMHSVAYEDTAPTALLAMIGQLLLILAAVQIHASFIHSDQLWDNAESAVRNSDGKVQRQQDQRLRDNTRGSGKDMASEMAAYPEEITQYQWIKGLFAAGIVVVLVWQSISEYNLFDLTNDEYMNFRRKENRHHYTPVITIFAYVATGLAAVVTLLFEFYMLKAHTKIMTEEYDKTNSSKIPSLWKFHRNGNTAMVLKHIASDVPLIAGFCLLGIAVLMQCNVTATHSVIGLALLLAVAGFLQHVSNVIKGLYTRICARLDARLVTQLTLHDSYSDEASQIVNAKTGPERGSSLNPDAKNILSKLGPADQSDQYEVESKVRPVLQYFGYSRLYIFLLVVIAAFVFVFVAKDTTHVHTLHTMLDGQLLYFSIAFVFCNVGFDILYETLPFMFESESTEAARIYIVLLYVIFFNVNQILYFWRIPGA